MGTTPSKPCCSPRRVSKGQDSDDLAQALKALGHPVRLHLVQFLLHRGECVFGELAEHVGMAPSTVSQHVAVLREAGILCAQPEGRSICYCVDSTRLDSIKRLVQTIL